MANASITEPRFKYGDRSGLTLGERNAIIFYAKGDREAAAKALGWTASKMRELGPMRPFIEKEIERIKAKAQARAERKPAPPEPDRKPQRRTPIMTPVAEAPLAPHRASSSQFEEDLVRNLGDRIDSLAEMEQTRPTIEERVRLEAARSVLEHPDRLDEREAEPKPPDHDLGKLDEREPEVPPAPSPPPLREDEPEDSVEGRPQAQPGPLGAMPTVDEIRAWITATFEVGEFFKAGAVRMNFGLSRQTTRMRLKVLLDEDFLFAEGEKATTRYRRLG